VSHGSPWHIGASRTPATRPWVDEVAERRDHYLYYNGHGDLAAEANSSGVVTATHGYDAFGAPLDTPPANATS
jgi:hypothetical protein